MTSHCIEEVSVIHGRFVARRRISVITELYNLIRTQIVIFICRFQDLKSMDQLFDNQLVCCCPLLLLINIGTSVPNVCTSRVYNICIGYKWGQSSTHKSKFLKIDTETNSVMNTDTHDVWQTVRSTEPLIYTDNVTEFSILVERSEPTTNLWKFMVGLTPQEFTCEVCIGSLCVALFFFSQVEFLLLCFCCFFSGSI